jgi:hypothetical protein
MSKNLLAYLLPMILGKVSGYWKSQGGTTSALTSLFADQKRNIADAVPAGFALSDIPGFGDAGKVYRAAGDTGRRAGDSAADTTRRVASTAGSSGRSIASWAIPLALLLVGGFLLWNYFRTRPDANAPVAQSANQDADQVTVMKPVAPDVPAIPNVDRVMGDFKGLFESANSTFAEIKDASAAETAEPKLRELSAKIDTLGEQLRSLPEAGQRTIRTYLDEQLVTFKKQADETAALPNLGERIKALIIEIINKLQSLLK